MHRKKNSLLEQPTPLILEGVNDIIIENQCLERHLEDIFQVDEGLPCTFSKRFFNPLQHWIELACARTCYHISDFCIGYHVCNVISFCSHDVLEIPTYIGLIFNVTLFWIITKRKGSVHCLILSNFLQEP
jgi:hypothetical protein